MFLFTLEEIVWRYRRLLIVLLAVSVIQVFELVFLHYKYTIFTSGFLQPFAYQSALERTTFVLLSICFDLFFYGILASIWFFVAGKLNRHGIIIYYYFTVLVVISIGIWLGLKFKVLSYFSDTINLQILKNLGGGNLQEALTYASDEIVLFTSAICVVIFSVIFTLTALSKNKFVQHILKNDGVHGTYIVLLMLVVLITPVMTLWVSNNDFFRYGLEKKISYQLISKILDKVSDIDSDGFGVFAYPKDTASLNTTVYPGALDIPGDGIDQDGFLGDALVMPIENDSLANITPRPGKHIVLIVLESARAEVLSHQVNNRYVAPALRDLAQHGSSILYAYSHTGYTTTSLKAIFNRQLINSKRKITLVKFLQAAGYQLSVISGQDESFGGMAESVGTKNSAVNFFDARSAIADRVYSSKDAGSLKLSEERLVKQFQARVKQVNFSKPQFFYINIQGGHFPYTHPKMPQRFGYPPIPRSEITPANKKWVTQAYWNAMASVDWAVAKMVAALKTSEVFDKTTLVILGDHGESLFDDGFLGHGHAINDTQTKIPLIINDANVITGNVPVGQTDVAEIMLRSALGEKNISINNDKQVFQIVGSLSHPVLCAHVAARGVRTIFDFRSEMFFFSDLNSWKSYQNTLLDTQLKDRAVKLIREWESLRWREFVENQ